MGGTLMVPVQCSCSLSEGGMQAALPQPRK